eukprot:GHVT01045890.1.p1 GENE.GHVT01045890.1~~GHVT01045890.1.p1  ORF type:complete len:582 (+),score=39.26 GHVT01045890.1:845-2590(+)
MRDHDGDTSPKRSGYARASTVVSPRYAKASSPAAHLREPTTRRRKVVHPPMDSRSSSEDNISPDDRQRPRQSPAHAADSVKLRASQRLPAREGTNVTRNHRPQCREEDSEESQASDSPPRRHWGPPAHGHVASSERDSPSSDGSHQEKYDRRTDLRMIPEKKHERRHNPKTSTTPEHRAPPTDPTVVIALGKRPSRVPKEELGPPTDRRSEISMRSKSVRSTTPPNDTGDHARKAGQRSSWRDAPRRQSQKRNSVKSTPSPWWNSGTERSDFGNSEDLSPEPPKETRSSNNRRGSDKHTERQRPAGPHVAVDSLGWNEHDVVAADQTAGDTHNRRRDRGSSKAEQKIVITRKLEPCGRTSRSPAPASDTEQNDSDLPPTSPPPPLRSISPQPPMSHATRGPCPQQPVLPELTSPHPEILRRTNAPARTAAATAAAGSLRSDTEKTLEVCTSEFQEWLDRIDSPESSTALVASCKEKAGLLCHMCVGDRTKTTTQDNAVVPFKSVVHSLSGGVPLLETVPETEANPSLQVFPDCSPNKKTQTETPTSLGPIIDVIREGSVVAAQHTYEALLIFLFRLHTLVC